MTMTSAREVEISTHAPLAGRDLCNGRSLPLFHIGFQPTRPLRGATNAAVREADACDDFNPRAPCGARRVARAVPCCTARISTHAPLAGRDERHHMINVKRYAISTHAPLAGRDAKALNQVTRPKPFQPTRPLRGATRDRRHNFAEPTISTHAPLAGRDCGDGRSGRDAIAYFNPRAPCGARLDLIVNCPERYEISTHAPLAGRDGCCRFGC